jgi:predicted DsbA family dithiol-disulfide isomerase
LNDIGTHPPGVLQIDIVSDVVCPWCYIGKRQLDQAVSRWQAGNPGWPAPATQWRPFQLNPDMPASGMPRSAYLQQKFGSPDGGSRFDRVRAAAQAVGLDLRLDAIRIQPSTLKAHALLELADEHGNQMVLAEALFRAYFIDGRDLSDDARLREIAAGVGMDAEMIEAALTSESVTRLVAAADAELREYGISGVPLFIIGSDSGARLAVSGAQGADALLETMQKVQAAA